MIQAFYTGLSGMMNHQYAIDVEADNLANASTTAFKGSQAEFSTILDRTVSQASSGRSDISNGVGVGTQIQTVALNMDKGTLQLTDSPTDLAITDDGWFGIKAYDKMLYTRDGAFQFDANRNLVTLDGLFLQGTMANNVSNGVLTKKLESLDLADISQQENLQFPTTLSYPPEPTTSASFFGNLGTEDKPQAVSSLLISPNNEKNTLKLSFKQSSPQPPLGLQWDVVATNTKPDGTTLIDTQNGTVTFDETGALTSFTLPAIDNEGVKVSLDLGSGYSGVIASSGSTQALSSSSNGLSGGDLIDYAVNPQGEIVASFTNGKRSVMGKVALYHFQNDQGLIRANGSRFAQSANSGEALFFKDNGGTNINGSTIQTNRLESSNVAYEEGLTNLIILQRAYDANSKSISTSDQMLQKALNMDA